MELLGWALIQYDWRPYKKRKFEHRHVQKEDNMKTQGENGHPEATEGGLEHVPSHSPQKEHRGLRLLASKTVRRQIFVV